MNETLSPPETPAGPVTPMEKSVAAPFTIFLTGLPAAGKTTLSRAVSAQLTSEGYLTRVWDGDEVRSTVSADLGFSREDRIENIRRMAKLAADSEEPISIVAAVSPSNAARGVAEEVISSEREFFLVWVATPAEVCESRDPKGLYARARAGEIENFTGVSDPYEAPENADLIINTTEHSIEDSVALVMAALRRRRLIG